MNVSELDAEVSAAVGAAWSSNTLSTRNSQWKKYLKFCADTSQVPLPADTQTVVRFLVYLARSCKYSTVNNYLSAVISLHKFYGCSVAFRDSYLVKLVLRGLRSQLGDSKVQMQPLTIEQLKSMHEMAVSSYEDGIMWSALMLAFRTLLRKSNVVPDSPKEWGHVVRRRDVQFHEWGAMVCVRSSKTLQCEEYVLEIPIYYVDDPIFCVVTAIKKHFIDLPGDEDGPIFLCQTRGMKVPVLYKDVLAFLKRAVAAIGLPPPEYGTHSMRRSGVAFLHGIGVPLEDLMAMGDWHSLAVLDYLITPLSRKMDIQSRVVTSGHLSVWP